MYFLKTIVIFISIFLTAAHADKNDETELSVYLQKLEESPVIPILGDYVVLEKTSDQFLNNIQNGKEDILERCVKFLTKREIKIKLPKSEARDLLAGARSKKIRKIILPLLLLLKLKAAIILPIILSIIALVSFKGFGLSLAALAVAGTTALKNILEHVGSKVSYEVVQTPVGHWSRAGAIDSTLATAAASYQY
ncbi:hypothetical protein ABEB36_010209 [Hypothenemus hampei]|uniref:Uncharacterized protein n=1 Tax=Hypothenemus hampei TaxID=57062 RepID=A0ABD1EIW3_HYPHA